MAKSDSIMEMIQVHAYLEDIPDIGGRDFGRYPPHYGDPNYIFRPKNNGDNRKRDQNNKMRDRSNLTERERIDCSNAGNRYLTPFNNLQEGIHEQNISQYPPLPGQRRLSELEDDMLETDPIDNWLIREAGSRRIPTSIASVRIPRPTSTSSETPLLTSGRVRSSLITELDSFPKRRALFEDEDTLKTRTERSQIVEDPFSKELVNPDIGVPGISSTGISSRPTPPVNTSVGETVPPLTSVPGIVMYGGGPTSP